MLTSIIIGFEQRSKGTLVDAKSGEALATQTAALVVVTDADLTRRHRRFIGVTIGGGNQW